MNKVSQPLLTIVIPTIGRKTLLETVRAITACKGFESVELIVVGEIPDKNIREQLQSIMDQYPQIKYMPISYPQLDISVKKNNATNESHSELIAFIDDDVVVSPEWIQKIIDPFKNPAVGMACGPSLLPESLPLVTRLTALIFGSRAAGFASNRYSMPLTTQPRFARWYDMIGCNMVCRKSALQHIGGFEPDMIPGEDMFAAFRMEQSGYKLMFVPEATVLHYPRQTLSKICRQVYRFGSARIRLIRAGVDFKPHSLAPLFFVLALLICGILSFTLPEYGVPLLIALLTAYVLFILWATLELVFRTKKLNHIAIFFLIPFLHISYGLGELAEIILPNRKFSKKMW
jgi:GT2 family glycosyltransferase